MADDRAEAVTEQPGGKPQSPTTPTDRARKAAEAAAGAMKGTLPVEHGVSPGEPVSPPHTPTAPEEGDGSNAAARGRSLGDTPPSFSQRLEELRRMMPSLGTPDRCREEPER